MKVSNWALGILTCRLTVLFSFLASLSIPVHRVCALVRESVGGSRHHLSAQEVCGLCTSQTELTWSGFRQGCTGRSKPFVRRT